MIQARLLKPKAVTRNEMRRVGMRRGKVSAANVADWLLSPMTGRRAVMLCGVFALAALLGGCQVMAPVGEWTERQVDAGWRGTKSVVSTIAKPLSLRSAPKDVAVFHPAAAHADTHDAGLNRKALERAVWIAKLNQTDRVSLEAIDRTLDNGVMVFRPGSGARRIETRPPMYRPAIRQPYGAAPILRQPRPAPPQPEAVSYVRLDGSLDMADWSACESEVGGAFLVSPRQTRVAPDFDACMRSKGYVDEGEAERLLSR